MLAIGWGHADITPPRPAMLQGQKHTRIAREAMDPLTLTAVAMHDSAEEQQAVFVSIDMAYPSEGMYRLIRERIAAQLPDLDPQCIILTATHTHTSLVVEDGFYDPPSDATVMTPAECEAFVVERVTEAIVSAWKGRRPHALARAFGHAVVGHNRHAVYADGHAQMYGRAATEDFVHFGGYEDHSLDMVFAWNESGGLAGLMLAVPCPSQVDEGLTVFSADYWHEVRIELRRRLGASLHVVGMCAPAGDQSPHFLIYGPQEQQMRERRGVTERQEIAQRIADAVQRALACTRPDAAMSSLHHRVDNVRLTPRQISRTERDWAQQAHEKSVADGDATGWWPTRLGDVVRQFDGVKVADPYEAEVHTLRLGDMAISTNPFELFMDYSMRIKARSAAAQTMLVQLTGRGFYLPSRRAVEGGGYGAMPAVSQVGPEGGDELVSHTVRAIGGLFER